MILDFQTKVRYNASVNSEERNGHKMSIVFDRAFIPHLRSSMTDAGVRIGVPLSS